MKRNTNQSSFARHKTILDMNEVRDYSHAGRAKRFWWWMLDHRSWIIGGVVVILVLVFYKDTKKMITKWLGSTHDSTAMEQPKDMTDSTTVTIVPPVIDTVALKKQWERERVVADSLAGLIVVDSVFSYAEFNNDGKIYQIGYYLLSNGEKKYIDEQRLVQPPNKN